MKRWIAIYLFSSVVFAAPPPVPSAGVVERELEKEYENEPIEPGKEIPNIQIDIPEEHYELPPGTSVEISGIEIEGNRAISCEEITSWLEPYISPKRTCNENDPISNKGKVKGKKFW